MASYDIPVLIIAFNRPEISKQTFDAVRVMQPSFLYVSIDGARRTVEGEEDKVNEVLSIYQNVDWPCQAKYHQNKENLGAEITVSTAISWILSEHEYCIVLEDDILASKAFFDFARDMLLKYKNADNVYQISAAQFTPIMSMRTDYIFSIYGHTGFGWATWRRAWTHFSMDLCDFDSTLSNKSLRAFFSCGSAYRSFLRSVRKMKRRGSDNCSWDRCWNYIRTRDGGISIVPKANLTKNIGVWGLHANGSADYHKYECDYTFRVSQHPTSIAVNKQYDKYHYWHYLHHGFISLIINKIKSIF